MICPYLQENQTTIEIWGQAFDAESEQTGHGITVTSNFFTPQKCLKEGCAAFRDGKCRYTKE